MLMTTIIRDARYANKLLDEARQVLESLGDSLQDIDLADAADDIGPVLLALEDWQRKHQAE